MRIAFISIPRFPCAVEVQRQPGLAGRSLIVGDAEQPKRVLDCSLSASRKYVHRGMTIRRAVALCPEATIVPPDPVHYRNTWEAILRALNDVTPEIDDENMGRAYLNVTGLELHYRSEGDLCEHILSVIQEASGLDTSIGLATGKFCASAAGTITPLGIPQIVPAGSEAEFLAPLASSLLPFDKEIIARLHLLGLDRISDIATLSMAELLSQFGIAGKRLWQLVHGFDDEPLNPRKCVEPLEAAVSLEFPVAGIDVMIAIARQLLSQLKPSLNGRAARELTLQAELVSGRGWEHHLVFREAVSEDQRLAFLLRSALTNFPPPQAIRSLCLRLGNLTGETGKQLSLGRTARRERQLQEAIRQLKARYGYSLIYRCVEVEPWSTVPEERQILVESDF